MKKHQIKPSGNFVQETLQRIEKAYAHQVLMTKIFFASFVIMPLILREVWNWTRNDYFSPGKWPLGEYLVSFYHFINADSLRMYVWVLGVSAILIYFWGYQFILAPAFKRIGHIFNREQRARA